MDVDVLERVKKESGFQFDLKNEQKEVIQSIINQKDVSAILPTGFGKSICYIMPPLYLDAVEPAVRHIAVVISPLLSLIEDQKRELEKHNISSYGITHETCKDLDNLSKADVSIIFTTPETLQNKQWRNVLLKEEFKKRLCLVACDEAHCVSDWGENFRPEFRQISTIRSFTDAPFMALTATATDKVQADIFKYLLFDETEAISVAVVPNRPNIFLELKKNCTRDFQSELEWFYKYLQENDEWKKTIIFCRSYSQVFEVWSWLVDLLGQRAFVDEKSARSRKVEMFHSSTDEASKKWILQNFPEPDSTVKVLVCTIAFGMGISIKDTDVIIHWGAPNSVLAYWQEIGRCGRGGQPSYAIMYPYRHSLIPCMSNEEVKTLAKLDSCVREYVLTKLKTKDMKAEDIPSSAICHSEDCELCTCTACNCCSVCHERCKCAGKIDSWAKMLI